ncbi:MAG: hypothetical protein ACRD6W_19100, partial [Nitrososphaerales archaeon]
LRGRSRTRPTPLRPTREDMKKLGKKQTDTLIESTYRKHCNGIQINIMDIGKVFAAGRKALEEGRDLDQAIIDFVETIRVDGKKREVA